MEVYRLALFAGDLAWHDVSRLIKDGRTRSLADQLYRAIGSMSANIAEGYSRRSVKDQARFYEYVPWARLAKHVYGTIKLDILCLEPYRNTESRS
jgi:hypothetical protein